MCLFVLACVRQRLFLAHSCVCHAGLQTSMDSFFSTSHLVVQYWDLCSTISGFPVGAGDLNSDPYACRESTLPAIFPAPKIMYV